MLVIAFECHKLVLAIFRQTKDSSILETVLVCKFHDPATTSQWCSNIGSGKAKVASMTSILHGTNRGQNYTTITFLLHHAERSQQKNITKSPSYNLQNNF